MQVNSWCAWLVAALAWGQAASQAQVAIDCEPANKACLHEAIRSHVVRRPEFWRADFSRPLADRIGNAPPQLIEYVTLDNMKDDYPERPRAPLKDDAFIADVRAAFAELPASVQVLFERRLIGIYLLDELGGTGWTEVVRDGSSHPMGGMIVLDASVLKARTANQWATWKENTPFKPDPRWQLHARIEDAERDTRRYAIQFILLHELGHVLSIGSDVHPSWLIDPKDVDERARFPFFELSWRTDRQRDRFFSLFDLTLARRDDVVYYFGARLAASDMVPLHTTLEQTNFPTLYAATRPGDDFAESFASYVHTVLMRKPWEITLSRDGQVTKTIKSCWEEPRCAAKRAVLEEVLRRP
ncbi:MAG: hypothetical protein H7255_11490 [Ramlibacter sp.]|nr:hypothetical protein [Ramlibacter sp.]